MHSTALHAIRQVEHMKQGDRTIHLLGKALIQAFRIPPGQEIALLLAHAPARNNEQAVYQWVRETLSHPSKAVAEAALPVLVDAFAKRLHELEELSWEV